MEDEEHYCGLSDEGERARERIGRGEEGVESDVSM